MLSDSIPVFLNGNPRRVAPGSTLADLLAHDDPDLGRALELGRAKATDGRGIAIAPGTRLTAGSILRVAHSARANDAPDA